jgi:hypothetical protein
VTEPKPTSFASVVVFTGVVVTVLSFAINVITNIYLGGYGKAVDDSTISTIEKSVGALDHSIAKFDVKLQTMFDGIIERFDQFDVRLRSVEALSSTNQQQIVIDDKRLDRLETIHDGRHGITR